LLQDLLRAFDADPEEISRESIASAQNLLFDAIHCLCASSASVFALGTQQNAAHRAGYPNVPIGALSIAKELISCDLDTHGIDR
jgi:hypothetical protein